MYLCALDDLYSYVMAMLSPIGARHVLKFMLLIEHSHILVEAGYCMRAITGESSALQDLDVLLTGLAYVWGRCVRCRSYLVVDSAARGCT